MELIAVNTVNFFMFISAAVVCTYIVSLFAGISGKYLFKDPRNTFFSDEKWVLKKLTGGKWCEQKFKNKYFKRGGK